MSVSQEWFECVMFSGMLTAKIGHLIRDVMKCGQRVLLH